MKWTSLPAIALALFAVCAAPASAASAPGTFPSRAAAEAGRNSPSPGAPGEGRGEGFFFDDRPAAIPARRPLNPMRTTAPNRTNDPAPNAQPIRKHWFVSGQVQGVGFRAFTYENATDLKLSGWVRNLTDGRVEIVAQGDPAAIARLLEHVKKGPRFSRVDGVKEAAADMKEKLDGQFHIRDSARPPKGAR